MDFHQSSYGQNSSISDSYLPATYPYFYFWMITFYTPPHNSGGVLWFHIRRPWSVRLSVRPSYIRPSVRPSVHFSILDDNLSKNQWIFTKLGMCIDIVEILFGIANGQISSNFYGVIFPRHAHIFVSGR